VSKDSSFLLLKVRLLTNISVYLKYLKTIIVAKITNIVSMEIMPTLTSNVTYVTHLFIEFMPSISLKYSLILRKNNSEVFV
jgi:hypothetical protein